MSSFADSFLWSLSIAIGQPPCQLPKSPADCLERQSKPGNYGPYGSKSYFQPWRPRTTGDYGPSTVSPGLYLCGVYYYPAESYGLLNSTSSVAMAIALQQGLAEVLAAQRRSPHRRAPARVDCRRSSPRTLGKAGWSRRLAWRRPSSDRDPHTSCHSYRNQDSGKTGYGLREGGFPS
jgi:hypothetical protein